MTSPGADRRQKEQPLNWARVRLTLGTRPIRLTALLPPRRSVEKSENDVDAASRRCPDSVVACSRSAVNGRRHPVIRCGRTTWRRSMISDKSRETTTCASFGVRFPNESISIQFPFCRPFVKAPRRHHFLMHAASRAASHFQQTISTKGERLLGEMADASIWTTFFSSNANRYSCSSSIKFNHGQFLGDLQFSFC